MTSNTEVATLRLIPYQKYSAEFNMAADEYLFQNGINTLRFYGWEPSALSFGKFKTDLEEIDVDYLLSVLN